MSSDPRIGTTIHAYRIEGLIGRGGMGVVYLAEHIHLEKKVALKVLAPDLAHDESFRKRFKQESQIAAKLFHPNVIPVHDAGEINGDLYIAMEYIEGTDLAALLANETRLAPERALRILEQVAAALDTAHKRGLVHRDVKPANILLTPEGEPGREHVFLTDFGLTKRTQAATELTKTGYFMGTLNYVAPEQIEGRPVDGRTDQYALGCVLYECLAGKPPYVRDDERAVLWAQLSEPPPSISAAHPELPAAVDAVVGKAMAKRQEDRYPDCASFAEAARAALGVREGAAPPRPGPGETAVAAGPPGGRAPTEYAPAPAPPAGGTISAPPVPSAPARRRWQRRVLLGAASVGVVVAVLLVLVLPDGEPVQDAVDESVILDDDFSGRCRWEEATSQSIEQGCFDGTYRFRILEGGEIPATAIQGTSTLNIPPNVTAEAEIQKVTGSSNASGLSCYYASGVEAYYFIIRPGQTWAIQKAHPDIETPTGTVDLAASGKDESELAIQRGNSLNRLRIDCSRSPENGSVTLVLSVNGKEVGRFIDSPEVDPVADEEGGLDPGPPLEPGAVGLAFNGDAGVDVRFDNLVVRNFQPERSA